MKQYPLHYTFLGKTPLIQLEGELTSGSYLNLLKTYNGLREDCAMDSVALDFSNITYINSSGIASLIDIIHDMHNHNGKVSFIALSEHLENRMEYLGLLDFINVYPARTDFPEQ